MLHKLKKTNHAEVEKKLNSLSKKINVMSKTELTKHLINGYSIISFN